MVNRVPIAVVYTYRRKTYVKEFTDLRCPDPLITSRSNRLPKGCEILHIGQGSKFFKQYQAKYL